MEALDLDLEALVSIGRYMVVIMCFVSVLLVIIGGMVLFFSANLLRRSEERIDKTNEMVSKLADAALECNRTTLVISKEYSTHLRELQECRDKVVNENIILAKQLAVLESAATAPHTTINNN